MNLDSNISWKNKGMDAQAMVEKLLEEQPCFHEVKPRDAKILNLPVGPTNYGLGTEAIRHLAQLVKPNHRTIETGGGYSTVTFAACGQHHTCISFDESEVTLVKNYLQNLEIPLERVEFKIESSEIALAKISRDLRFDVALIDGAHGFPFPILDWYYIDNLLNVGGILAVDDIYLPPVKVLLDYLNRNGTYQLDTTIASKTAFYTKLASENIREWVFQKYSKEPLYIGPPLEESLSIRKILRKVPFARQMKNVVQKILK